MSYHFIGIGGIGMSGLAKILLERGAKVQGSDLSKSYMTETLQKAGAVIFETHQAEVVSSGTTVVFNSQIKQNHPEFVAAKKLNLSILHRSELLKSLMEGSKPLLVTGTHGKTTTSSLLAHVLHEAEQSPSFAVGGVALNFNTNGAHGSGDYFVAEADESDGSFLNYPAFGAIITNVEEDHLDHWKTKKSLFEGFQQFASRPMEHLWWNGNDNALRSMGLIGKTYGQGRDVDVEIVSWSQKGWSLFFELYYEGEKIGVELPLVGFHNVMNGAAVFGLCRDLGIPARVIQEAFKTFKGVKRRLEKKGNNYFDDYAHHPTEIATTLSGVREAVGERRLIAVFQPHRYTRFRDCWNEFLNCFGKADLILVTDVYAAREEPIPKIDAHRFASELQAKTRLPVLYVPSHRVVETLSTTVRPHDVVITLGAGDITEMCTAASHCPVRPYKVAICRGGRSAEHEVSLRSANRVMEAMGPEHYHIVPLTISKAGKWLFQENEIPLSKVVELVQTCDVVFPVLHGPFGEDGMIQGFLETVGVPYVGADFRSSAVCMDKAWTKHIAGRHGVEVGRFLEFSSHEWEKTAADVLQTVTTTFQYPFYVKAVHLGSSFGVYRVKNESGLREAIDQVCQLDYKFIVEEEIVGRELEFGFIGNFEIDLADPAEVVRAGEIHTYENKYSATGKPSIPKVPLSPEVLRKGREVALTVYRAVGCTGFARIDFFLKDDGTWVLNEVNPIPGCTPTSVYPLIWITEGVSFSTVVDRLVIAGLHRKRYQDLHVNPL